jgi:natural product biosynthesis luciferase-like monooxygenase protein
LRHFTSFIIGEGLLTLECAKALLGEGHTVLGLITANPLMRDWAEERSLQCVDSSGDISTVLQREPFDYLFSIVNYQVLPKEVLAVPRMGSINFHDSLLPKYAGAHATTWAIMRGETTHGVTWHAMTALIDGGDILRQQQVTIAANDTAHTLNLKCLEAGVTSFKELILGLAQGAIAPLKQDLLERTYFPYYLRPAAGCIVSWNRPARDLDAFVRALDFGSYPNPLGLAKIAVKDELVLLSQIRVLETVSRKAPGTVLSITTDSLSVATLDCDLAISRLLDVDGRTLSISDFVARFNLREGDRLEEIESHNSDRITKMIQSVCKSESYWIDRLTELEPLSFPLAHDTAATNRPMRIEEVSLEIPEEVDIFRRERFKGWSRGDFLLALFGVFLARVCDLRSFDLGLSVSEEWFDREFMGLFASQVPLRINVTETQTLAQSLEAIGEQIKLTRRHRTHLCDIGARSSLIIGTQNHQSRSSCLVAVRLGDEFDDHAASNNDFTMVIAEENPECSFRFNPEVLDQNYVRVLTGKFPVFLKNVVACADTRTVELSLLSEWERHQLLFEWNDTGTDYPQDKCLHHLFEEQVALTPEVIALVFEDKDLTFRELNEQANTLAHQLIDRGVGPESLVGICVERSLEMMVGLLAILKAGGAYVPLDPTYPKERLAFMLEDSRAPILLTQRRLIARIPANGYQTLFLDDEYQAGGGNDTQNPDHRAQPGNLAYVIYTSGSTGQPKGVMVSHKNVVNFCAGMDDLIGGESPGVWLAVTSISFDISILELFWTLARGFKVVIYSGKEITAPKSKAGVGPTSKAIEFSLAYFASDHGDAGDGKYRLLMEGAKFADRNGFSAIWTPERHFHSFGGLYPNPSVTSAAIAAVTNRIQIRAGSVVLPLHNPIRVAEEWSVVDNLSSGRVAISFASGWHPNDFVIAPQNYAERKQITLRDIETVRRLWRGESVRFHNGVETDFDVKILPRPIQPELPVWITAAGHPDTFRAAGEMGANLLTHLLGQSVEELADKINIYRQAWLSSGHGPKDGHVTLMLHTFVCRDTEAAREKVRAPFCSYLSSSVDLIKKARWSFPAFKSTPGKETRDLDQDELTPDEMDAVLEHAFNRYFETSGLFGSLERCAEMAERLRQIGVDEIACLIDFGVDFESVMSSLQDLKALKIRCEEAAKTDEERFSLPALMARHRVTHLQCTPSLITMLLHDDRARESLASLHQLFLGGEALPQSLADRLGELLTGKIINMYGPTETTIWSTTAPVIKGERVNIGRPIANTEVYILDQRRQPVPVGIPGEVIIGGAGVTRGYLHRPDLNADKFAPTPFKNGSGERVYRTGDLARYLPDGNIEFLGRLDQQIKIRGFRIELGEIETILNGHPAVREAVVTVKERAPAEKRMVAYVISRKQVSTEELRDWVSEKLPEHMMPSAFVFLKAFPLAPNGKLNRRLLPDPETGMERRYQSFLPPRTALEEVVSSILSGVLGLERVGISDDFFALGGHSLLGAQVVSKIKDVFQIDLSLRELFEAPTVRALAKALVAREPKPGQAERIASILKKIQDAPSQSSEPHQTAQVATMSVV